VQDYNQYPKVGRYAFNKKAEINKNNIEYMSVYAMQGNNKEAKSMYQLKLKPHKIT